MKVDYYKLHVQLVDFLLTLTYAKTRKTPANIQQFSITTVRIVTLSNAQVWECRKEEY